MSTTVVSCREDELPEAADSPAPLRMRILFDDNKTDRNSAMLSDGIGEVSRDMRLSRMVFVCVLLSSKRETLPTYSNTAGKNTSDHG